MYQYRTDKLDEVKGDLHERVEALSRLAREQVLAAEDKAAAPQPKNRHTTRAGRELVLLQTDARKWNARHADARERHAEDENARKQASAARLAAQATVTAKRKAAAAAVRTAAKRQKLDAAAATSGKPRTRSDSPPRPHRKAAPRDALVVLSAATALRADDGADRSAKRVKRDGAFASFASSAAVPLQLQLTAAQLPPAFGVLLASHMSVIGAHKETVQALLAMTGCVVSPLATVLSAAAAQCTDRSLCAGAAPSAAVRSATPQPAAERGSAHCCTDLYSQLP